MKKTYIALGLIASAFMIFQSCEKFEPAEPLEEELLDGPIEGLSYEEQRRFLSGDEHPFVQFFRFGQKDGEFVNHFKHKGGRELQHKAIPGYKPEELPAEATFSRLIAPAVTGLGLLQYIPGKEIMKEVETQKQNGLVSGEINWIDKFDYSPIRTTDSYPQNV